MNYFDSIGWKHKLNLTTLTKKQFVEVAQKELHFCEKNVRFWIFLRAFSKILTVAVKSIIISHLNSIKVCLSRMEEDFLKRPDGRFGFKLK